MIQIIAIGKKHESFVQEGVERYAERLRGPWQLSWQLLPHSPATELVARSDESARISAKLPADAYVILLDETGQLVDSPKISSVIQSQLDHSKLVVIIIGGAYGVDKTLTSRADFVWSLSPLVFPHQLVRLLLSEQLYRSQEIAASRPYHHQ